VIYNEIDPFACQWLANLMAAGELPQGTIDPRSIKEVKPNECGLTSHFFAGIGGWPLALRVAGWPDNLPVWTGSCPCQPFSAVGKRKGVADDRHLWPEFFRLIDECRPAIVFGEQVASKDGLGWCDGVFAYLEGAGYTCGAADLCAASVGAPHIRQRLFWVAVANAIRHDRRQDSARARETEKHHQVKASSEYLRLEHTESNGRDERRAESSGWSVAGGCGESLLIQCRDGKTRRISAESSNEPLAYGIPLKLVFFIAKLREMGLDSKDVKHARGNRNGRLKGYGNAIVPEVAAVFIHTVMEWLNL